MSHSAVAQPSDADMAFEILKAKGGTIHYKELIDEILKRKGIPYDPAVVAAILTQINLDTRFAYYGQGEWGLKSRANARATRRIPTITLMHKSYDQEDDIDTYETSDDLDVLDLDDDDHEDLDDILEDDREEVELEEFLDDVPDAVDDSEWDD